MSNYIGAGPVGKQPKKYFYKLTRNSNSELILSKVDLDSPTDTVEINDMSLVDSNEPMHTFAGFDTSLQYVVINIDENHNVIEKSLGYTQYKVREENINYYIDENGNFIARLNRSYNY